MHLSLISDILSGGLKICIANASVEFRLASEKLVIIGGNGRLETYPDFASRTLSMKIDSLKAMSSSAMEMSYQTSTLNG